MCNYNLLKECQLAEIKQLNTLSEDVSRFRPGATYDTVPKARIGVKATYDVVQDLLVHSHEVAGTRPHLARVGLG